MKKSVSGIIKKIVTITDKLAGVCLFSVMALVLANIILRNVFKTPILGTMEIVGLLTVTGLGFALANCEMLGANIVMDVMTEKMSKKSQKVIDAAVYSISLCFWAVAAWRIMVFAYASLMNGRVTATVSVPIYPFIFVLGLNVILLCAVLAYKLANFIKEASAEFDKSANGGKGETT